MPADLTPTFEFLSTCLLGNPKSKIPPHFFGILECLSGNTPANVPSLEKISAHSVVCNAIEDVRKNAILERIVEENNIGSFSPLLFGDSSIVRQFIVTNLGCSEAVLFCVDPTETIISLGGPHVMLKTYVPDELPADKILEIIDSSLVKTTEARFMIHEGIKHLERFVFKLSKIAEERGYEFDTDGPMFRHNGMILITIQKS